MSRDHSLPKPTITNSSPSTEAVWPATLALVLTHKRAQTVLQYMKHHGPLRVQRPFYPEGPVCHLYLLHPPGGMVAGDNLSINVTLEEGAHGLLTTPAAGKFYRVEAYAEPQYQGVNATLAPGAVLEWLPQESIVFNDARGELINRFELSERSRLIGWDIVCLGRRASGEQFTKGAIKQRIEIYRDGRPLYIDRVNFDGGSMLLTAPWGMHRWTVSGTFFATVDDVPLPLDRWRKQLPELEEWGLTQRGEVLLARYLGHSAETCRRGFEALWRVLRPELLARPVHRPRIWNT